MSFWLGNGIVLPDGFALMKHAFSLSGFLFWIDSCKAEIALWWIWLEMIGIARRWMDMVQLFCGICSAVKNKTWRKKIPYYDKKLQYNILSRVQYQDYVFKLLFQACDVYVWTLYILAMWYCFCFCQYLCIEKPVSIFISHVLNTI